MFKRFGKKDQDETDQYLRDLQEMTRTIQSDIDEDNKKRIVTNKNEEVEEDYKGWFK